MKIIKGHLNAAVKTVLYGTEGIGKTTFASQFPDPLFIDTEGGTTRYDVARFEEPKTWNDILACVDYVIAHPDTCKTLVLDTADKAERMCIQHLLKQYDKPDIDAWGFGRGYKILADEFAKLVSKFDQVIAKGVNIVVVAHAAMRKFEQPDELGAYDRWELKLGKHTAPMLKEWADLLLFANYKTTIIMDENKKKKATGGKRVVYTTHNPVWDAKNRFGLPDELPFDFDSISVVIPGSDDYIEHVSNAEETTVSNLDVLKAKIDAFTDESEPEKPKKTGRLEGGDSKARAAARKKKQAQEDGGNPYTPDEELPFELAELMKRDGISAEQIEKVVASRGKMPADVKLKDYPENIIKNFVIKFWANIVAAAI